MNKLISDSTNQKLNYYIPFIKRAAEFTNHFNSTEEVEGAGTALFIIDKNEGIELSCIINKFKSWSKDKAERFSNEDIKNAVSSLEEYGFIENTFLGYKIKR